MRLLKQRFEENIVTDKSSYIFTECPKCRARFDNQKELPSHRLTCPGKVPPIPSEIPEPVPEKKRRKSLIEPRVVVPAPSDSSNEEETFEDVAKSSEGSRLTPREPRSSVLVANSNFSEASSQPTPRVIQIGKVRKSINPLTLNKHL